MQTREKTFADFHNKNLYPLIKCLQNQPLKLKIWADMSQNQITKRITCLKSRILVRKKQQDYSPYEKGRKTRLCILAIRERKKNETTRHTRKEKKRDYTPYEKGKKTRLLAIRLNSSTHARTVHTAPDSSPRHWLQHLTPLWHRYLSVRNLFLHSWERAGRNLSLHSRERAVLHLSSAQFPIPQM